MMSGAGETSAWKEGYGQWQQETWRHESLLHDITPAGRGRAAPSTGAKEADPGCGIGFIRAQPRHSPSRATHQSHSSSTDQSRTHAGWDWGAPRCREAAGHRNRREGISAMLSCPSAGGSLVPVVPSAAPGTCSSIWWLHGRAC